MSHRPEYVADERGRQEVRRILMRLNAHAAARLPEMSPLLITSASPGEGKSTVASALAWVAARELELKTVVVDLNWLEPSQHRCFGVECAYDLPDLLKRGPQACVTKLGRLAPCVLTAPRSADERFTGKRHGKNSRRQPVSWTQMRDFAEVVAGDEPEAQSVEGADSDENTLGRLAMNRQIMSLAKDYELVLLDAPPLFPEVPGPLDAVQLSTCANASLLVILMRATPRDTVKRACMALESASGNTPRVVMNNLRNLLPN